jgi:hypothetical protein
MPIAWQPCLTAPLLTHKSCDLLMNSLRSLPPAIAVKRWVLQQTEAWRYQSIVKRRRLPVYYASPLERLARELACSDLLWSTLRQAQLSDLVLYPIGGAASYGLLYILARALTEQAFSSVLELGAGQTTKLLGRYASISSVRVTTVEHDEAWIRRLRDGVAPERHTLVRAPIRSFMDSQVGRYDWYDLDALFSAREALPFDLFVIDGPTGTRHYSRFGIVPRFHDLCAEEWLVIWDDLDRSADLESFGEFVHRQQRAGVAVGCAFYVGQRTVGVAFTPKFEAVGHYF